MSKTTVTTQLDDPLNTKQVKRITAVHKGFLYQHLYGVACLLTVIREPEARLIVEHDEDLEIRLNGRSPYIQVKLRNRPLQYSDISGSIEQFRDIRAEHAEGKRTGTPVLRIVTNAALGAGLAALNISEDWPQDVRIVSPGDDSEDLPPSWAHVDEAFAWCVEKAQDIPFGALAPETLVWKLAALIQSAAAGGADRTFTAEQLPDLLEQLVVQLQDFPSPPENYRPQRNEPDLITKDRVRLITGFSGAGKTAWASQAAIHCPGPIAYIDIGEMPAASVAPDIARELAARFIGGRAERFGGALFADKTGLNVLRATDRMLSEQGLRVQVILDNVNRVDAAVIRALIDAAPGLRFLCLAQPWLGAGILEAQFGIEAGQLHGWTEDDVAAEFATAGAALDVATARRVLHLTGGLPLYVQNAARLSATEFGGKAEAFCNAIEKRTNDRETAQEVILCAAFEALNEDSRLVATVLSMSEVTLTREEVVLIVGDVVSTPARVAAALRSLRRSSMTMVYQGDRIALHDAMRPLAFDDKENLPPGTVEAVLNRLTETMMLSLTRERDIPRFSFMLRLLPLVGRTEALVDLAAYEMFHEQGDPRSLRAELQRAADNELSTPHDRFWAHDALAFWESRDGGTPSRQRLDIMQQLLDDGQLGETEQLNLIFKEMAYWGADRDRTRVSEFYAAGMALSLQAQAQRMLRYNYAVSMRRAGATPAARRIIEGLIPEFFRVLGFAENEMVGRGPAQLQQMVRDVDRDDLKRTADALALWSHLAIDMGEPPLLRRIAALKLYQQAFAARSSVDQGMEAADDFLVIMADPVGAREIMEQHVLPVLQDNELTDLVLTARSVYAIVLAWTGDVSAARREMAALAHYAVTAEEQRMLEERRHAITQIATGALRLERQLPPPDAMAQIVGTASRRSDRVGRNEPCMCGSGLKFKRCCGR